MAVKTNQKEIMHVRDVVSAAYTYSHLNWMTTTGLAASFKVSKNTISMWLLEAIEKGYVKDIKTCQAIKAKHIKEYEDEYGIVNSSLRISYQKAFDNRTVANPEIIAAI